MGLVQNLKKKFKNWGEKILVGLSSLFIRHLAKQIMKRRANSSPTMSSQKPLTTEPQSSIIATSSQGTSKKIIMYETIDLVRNTREWVMDRLADPELEYKDAMALADEFKEWINPQEDEIDVISIPE